MVEADPLSTPNKTRARGPAGRRPPSFKSTRHARRQEIGEQKTIEDNVDVVIVTDKNEVLDDSIIKEDALNNNLMDINSRNSLKSILWNSCQIM